MKVVRKLLAPLLVVGILLTSLISLHQLKADKKKDVFRIGISQFITHQSLDATREGFVDELAKQGYVEGKNIEIDLQNAQGEQRNLKTISQQLAESSDVVLAIATPSAQSLANTTQRHRLSFSCNRSCQCQASWVKRASWGQCNWDKRSVIRCHFNPNQFDKESVAKS